MEFAIRRLSTVWSGPGPLVNVKSCRLWLRVSGILGAFLITRSWYNIRLSLFKTKKLRFTKRGFRVRPLLSSLILQIHWGRIDSATCQCHGLCYREQITRTWRIKWCRRQTSITDIIDKPNDIYGLVSVWKCTIISFRSGKTTLKFHPSSLIHVLCNVFSVFFKSCIKLLRI